MPGVTYRSLRSRLRSGDIFMCSGDYFVSKAIRKFTKSPWSHVGIIFRIAPLDRVLLLESVEDAGVRFAPLSKYTKDYEKGKPYKGVLAVARHSGLNRDRVAKLAGFGMDELTRPYDVDEIAKIVARIALGRGRPKRDREYICSELVYECFKKARLTIRYDRRGFVSPENVWCDPNVRLLAKIAN
jgi:hypothetical protein